jgi:exodeoxyribonuclease X
MKAIILDVEATGLNEPEVIELAWAEVTCLEPASDFALGLISNYEQGERFIPTKPIEYGAMAVHHILMEDLVGCPPFSSWSMPRDVEYIVGHGVDFDLEAIGKPNVQRVDTLAMARYLWPTLDSHSLVALMYFLKGPTKDTRKIVQYAHSAAADVYMCWEILKAVVDKCNDSPTDIIFRIETINDLYKASEAARIPKVMAFGKYKGKPIAEVPHDYVRWYRKQDNLDSYLLKAFLLAGK